jgi:hypothetical protein
MPGEAGAAGPPARAHHAPELLSAPHPRLLRQHDPSCKPRPACGHRARLDGDLLAALAAARGQHGAASPGTHALTETVDLGPPAVIRLERALAHWNSRSVRKLRCLMKGGHAMRHAPGPSLDRHGGTADVAWVSLLTVRAILAQVKLSFSRVYHQATPRFPQRTGRRRPRLWKNQDPQIVIRGPAVRRGMGKLHRGARTHLVDEPVDNELRLAASPAGPARTSGNAARARGAHRE